MYLFEITEVFLPSFTLHFNSFASECLLWSTPSHSHLYLCSTLLNRSVYPPSIPSIPSISFSFQVQPHSPFSSQLNFVLFLFVVQPWHGPMLLMQSSQSPPFPLPSFTSFLFSRSIVLAIFPPLVLLYSTSTIYFILFLPISLFTLIYLFVYLPETKPKVRMEIHLDNWLYLPEERIDYGEEPSSHCSLINILIDNLYFALQIQYTSWTSLWDTNICHWKAMKGGGGRVVFGCYKSFINKEMLEWNTERGGWLSTKDSFSRERNWLDYPIEITTRQWEDKMKRSSHGSYKEARNSDNWRWKGGFNRVYGRQEYWLIRKRKCGPIYDL